MSNASIRRLHRFERLCESIAAMLAAAGVSPQQLLAGLPAARRRVFRKHYPDLASKRLRRKPL